MLPRESGPPGHARIEAPVGGAIRPQSSWRALGDARLVPKWLIADGSTILTLPYEGVSSSFVDADGSGAEREDVDETTGNCQVL